jgi:hypothetical protein
MIFTVDWSRTAERRLAEFWFDAPERGRVAHAANAIDELLRTDPFANSESREEGRRIMLIPPLGVK